VNNQRQIGQPLVDPSLLVGDFRFSPDGTILAAAGGAGWDINLWNGKTGQPIGQPLTWDAGLVASIAFSSDGKQDNDLANRLEERIVLGAFHSSVRMARYLPWF
jgi:hypothetical protein